MTKSLSVNAFISKVCFRNISCASTAILSAFAFGGSPALAQEQASTQVAQAEVAQAQGGLQEVVVTARKRRESIQDVPAAVSAISGAQLQRYDMKNLEAFVNQAPTLTVARGQSGSGAQLTIRGIGSSYTSIGIEQSVAVVLDGVYYGQGRVINEGFYDMGQLELLKGPQSLFFGKNSTAGVLSLTSNDPGPDFESSAKLGYEFYTQSIVGDAFVSTPLTDTLGLRIAVSGTDMFGGYIKNGTTTVGTYPTFDVASGTTTSHFAGTSGTANFPEDTNEMGRITLKWKPDDRLTATLKISGDGDNNDAIAWASVLDRCNGSPTTPAGVAQLAPTQSCGPKFVRYANNIPADIAATDSLANRHGGQTYDDYVSYQATGNINYVLPEVTITSVTNIQHFTNQWADDEDNTTALSIFADEKSSWNAASEELRSLTTFDFPLNFLGGFLYQNTRLNFDQNVYFLNLENSAAANPADRYVAYNKRAGTNGETYAVYGQGIYKFADNWEFDFGARWTHETKKSSFIQPYVNPALTGLFSQGRILGADQLFINVSPDATLTYKPFPETTIYAAFKTGYKSGGFSDSSIETFASSANDLAFKPEKARGFEGGVKQTLFGGHVRIRADGYFYRFSDLQVDYFQSTPFFDYQTFNAGSATTTGGELEVDYNPTWINGVNMRGSLNYNQARYSSFTSPCYSGQTPALGCNVNGNGAAQQNLSGHPTTEAPDWTASFGVTYEVPINDDFNFGISADSKYSSAYYYSQFGNPLDKQSAYVNIDATAHIATSDDQWQVAIIGKNLSNNFIRMEASDSPSSGGGNGTPGGFFADQLAAVGLPRTVEIQATWRFTPPATPAAPMAAAAPPPAEAPPAPPPAPAPEPQRAFQVFFDFDKSNITEAAAAVIQKASDSIKTGHFTRIMVTGHTDTVGSIRYNQKLSERRAAAVKQQLITDGVTSDEITTHGVGKTDLLVPTPDGVREPQNRRAEIVQQ